MWILDLGIDIPDFGPIPGVFEKCCGDIPESVANLNDIFIGSAFGEGRAVLRKRVERTQYHRCDERDDGNPEAVIQV